MRCFSSPGALRILTRSSLYSDGVAPFGNRGINACSRLPHAYRSYATSFIGTQRRGIHPLLILSSLKEDLVWTILDRLSTSSIASTTLLCAAVSDDHTFSRDQQC